MKQILTFTLLLTLSACGFTPLYANDPAGQIRIEMIEGRSGHVLRKNLLLELAPGLPGMDSPARLSIELDENLSRLALQPDEAATRTDIIAEARYELIYDDVSLTGKSEAETSFLVPLAPYSDLTSQIDASERAMALLARRIADDLRLQLSRKD